MRIGAYTRLIIVIALIVLSVRATSIPAQSRDRDSIDVQRLFTPSGWMGDGEYGRKYISLSGVETSAPHSPPTSIKIAYTFGPARWAGIYWQNQPDNWGERPGWNYSGKNLTRVSFWAKGEIGNEMVEFKAGGIDSQARKYRDSFAASTGRVTLSKEWKQYHIDLGGANLSSVIGAFCWVASSDYNLANQVTFYLDDIYLE